MEDGPHQSEGTAHLVTFGVLRFLLVKILFRDLARMRKPSLRIEDNGAAAMSTTAAAIICSIYSMLLSSPTATQARSCFWGRDAPTLMKTVRSLWIPYEVQAGKARRARFTFVRQKGMPT